MTGFSVLRLLRLRLRKSPGMDDGFHLSDLSGGVNLIYGPNASGKTSTARAIEAVLWKGGAGRGLSASAEYMLGDSHYHVDIDAGHVGVQRDGAEAPAPELPAPEFRHRYSLSLHDLISEDNADFASAVALQSAGGYDLKAAAEALGLRGKPSGSSAGSRGVEQARQLLTRARDAQLALQAEVRELDELEQQRDDARRAREREGLLALAMKHARAATRAAEARQELATFPAMLSELRGDEHERLREARDSIRTTDADARAAQRELDEANAAAGKLLAGGQPAPELLPTARAMLAAVERQEHALEEGERRVRDASGQLAEARREIGNAITDEQLALIDGVTFGELSAFAREAERVHADVAAAEAELRRAGDAAPPTDLETVRAGIRLLAQWLAEGASDGGRGSRSGAALVWLTAALAAAAWGLHALRWHWAFAALAVVAIVLAAVATRRPTEMNARELREREYDRLALPRPRSWGVEAVQAELDELHKRLADGLLAEQRTLWRDDARRRQAESAELLRELDVKRARLADRFGVAPDLHAWQLGWLADRIGRWQDAMRLAAGSHAALDAARERHAIALAALGDRLSEFGYQRATSAAEAAGIVVDLERQHREHVDASRQAEVARQRIAALQRRRSELQAACEEIFARVGVANDDDPAVEALCARHSAYVEARDAYRLADRDSELARAELEGAPSFEPALLECAIEALERGREDAAARAAELEPLTEKVARLRSDVERAKNGSDVEAALAELERAEADLLAARQRDLHAMVGDLVIQYVQRLARDQHRPAVFHRARDLFREITRGRYKLELEDGANPSFRAIDTESNRGHALSELSSATRVQLLLAVRVAFVETQEHGLRLPLLLDELLGTSDDHRAQAIIDAVITLAQGGRQIFYFTAQRDEVGKWVAALDARGMPCKLVDLAAERGRRSDDLFELPIAPVQLPALADPIGCTHEEYGALLVVPAIRPALAPIGATPLWYLVDDARALHHLLSLGIPTWGAFRNLVECGGASLLREFPGVWDRAAAFARALETLHELASIGRGRVVDRAVLVASGAVSGTHMENLVKLAAECEGRAALIIEALEGKRVTGFQTRKIGELRDYLEEAGNLDPRAPLTTEEIRAGMLAAVADEINASTIAPEDVDALLHRIQLRAKPLVPDPGALQLAGEPVHSVFEQMRDGS